MKCPKCGYEYREVKEAENNICTRKMTKSEFKGLIISEIVIVLFLVSAAIGIPFIPSNMGIAGRVISVALYIILLFVVDWCLIKSDFNGENPFKTNKKENA